MKMAQLQLATITFAMVAVTLRAWRAGDARRDVWLMAAVTAGLAVGTALLSAWG